MKPSSLSGETGLGVIFKNGNLRGVIFFAATNSERLLQNGTVLLCCKGRQCLVWQYSGHVSFYFCQAFDMLERLDPNPEYWEGKRGAAVGVFQMIIAGREDRSVSGGE